MSSLHCYILMTAHGLLAIQLYEKFLLFFVCITEGGATAKRDYLCHD